MHDDDSLCDHCGDHTFKAPNISMSSRLCDGCYRHYGESASELRYATSGIDKMARRIARAETNGKLPPTELELHMMREKNKTVTDDLLAMKADLEGG